MSNIAVQTAIPADFGVGGKGLTPGGGSGSPSLSTLLAEYKANIEALDTALMAAQVDLGVDDAKNSVRAASTTNLVATRTANVLTADANGALGAMDGVTLVVGNRVLLKDQSTGADNGPYTITSLGAGGAPWVMTRAADADTSAKVTAGLSVQVSEGTLAGNKRYVLTTDDAITLNTTALTFTKQATLAEFALTTAGNGASLIGVEDSASQLTAVNVETALAELAAKFTAGVAAGITRLQFITGTLVAGTDTVSAGIIVTALTKVFAIPTAAVTGSTNFGCLGHTIASNVVGAAGVGAVTVVALGNDGAIDTDAAGAYAAILVN